MVDALLKSLGFEEFEEPISVRFVNTVGARRGMEPDEYLKAPGDLQAWMVRRNLLPGAIAIDADYRERALELRDGIYAILSALAAGRSPHPDEVEVLNAELAEALAKIELVTNNGAKLEWVLAEKDPRERALMLIALSAASFATGPSASRIRECANDTCGWIFLDHSKNRSRRWCSMNDCGNKEKARRFQARRRAAAPSR